MPDGVHEVGPARLGGCLAGEHPLKRPFRHQPPACNSDRREHSFPVCNRAADAEDFGGFLDGVGLPFDRINLLVRRWFFVCKLGRHWLASIFCAIL